MFRNLRNLHVRNAQCNVGIPVMRAILWTGAHSIEHAPSNYAIYRYCTQQRCKPKSHKEATVRNKVSSPFAKQPYTYFQT